MKRQCGGCTLCCKLLPVRDGVLVDGKRVGGGLDKDAGVRCPHQRTGKGCAVYGSSKMPLCCKMWNCEWLTGDTPELSRPDRTHYVIDVCPDFVYIVDNETGEQTRVEVIQVWCDPNYPDAHRDPALRRYLEKQGKMVLVRYDESRGLNLIPPQLAGGKWMEVEGQSLEREHSVKEIMEFMEGGSC